MSWACAYCGDPVEHLEGGLDRSGVRCPECDHVLCDDCYDCTKGDGCGCHPELEREPDEGDLVTADHQRFYSGGKLRFVVREGATEREMWEQINAWMEGQGFFPNVWFESDHGNMHLLTPPPPPATTEVELPCFGMRLTLTTYCDEVSGVIASDLERDDPALQAIESLVLAHACAGVDVTTHAYVEGIETAVDAVLSHEED